MSIRKKRSLDTSEIIRLNEILNENQPAIPFFLHICDNFSDISQQLFQIIVEKIVKSGFNTLLFDFLKQKENEPKIQTFTSYFKVFLEKNKNLDNFHAITLLIYILQHSKIERQQFFEFIDFCLQNTSPDNQDFAFNYWNLDIINPYLYLLYFGNRNNISNLALIKMEGEILKKCVEKHGDLFIKNNFHEIILQIRSGKIIQSEFIKNKFQEKEIKDFIYTKIDSIYLLYHCVSMKIISVEDAKNIFSFEQCKIDFESISHRYFRLIFQKEKDFFGRFSIFLSKTSNLYTLFLYHDFSILEKKYIIKNIIPINMQFFNIVDDLEIFSFGLRFLPSNNFVDLLNKVTPSFCDVRDFNYNCMSEIFSNHIIFCSKSDQNYFENIYERHNELTTFSIFLISKFILIHKKSFCVPIIDMLKLYVISMALNGNDVNFTSNELDVLNTLYGPTYLDSFLENLYYLLQHNKLFTKITNKVFFHFGNRIMIFTNFLINEEGNLFHFENSAFTGIHAVWKNINNEINYCLRQTNTESQEFKNSTDKIVYQLNSYRKNSSFDDFVFGHLYFDIHDMISKVFGNNIIFGITIRLDKSIIDILKSNIKTKKIILHILELNNKNIFNQKFENEYAELIKNDQFIQNPHNTDIVEMRKSMIRLELQQKYGLTECPICIEMTNMKCSLSCGHVLCKSCIYGLADKNDRIKCPNCRVISIGFLDLFF